MKAARFAVFAVAAIVSFSTTAVGKELTPEQKAIVTKYKAILDSLHPQSGDVTVPQADAVLHLGSDYYFLDAVEAKRVLTEGWGNPADAVSDVIGMVFPAGKIFADDTWGSVVTFNQTGYVSDSDAASADYNKILQDVRSGEDERNRDRQSRGIPAEHLVGWATPPSYNSSSHALIWARDIRFGDEQDDTLNYDTRLLGRRGVLSLNTVSSMSHLGEIRTAAANLATTAEFKPGTRYADYKAGVDKDAGYGLAGLVAAGVGVAAAKKFGLLALLAVFGKKLLILGVAMFALAGRFFRRIFGRAEKGE